MGIGRRDFLVMFGSTLTVLAGIPTPAVAVEDDLYLNRALGLAFRKPSGWQFANLRDMGTVAKGQLLALDSPDIRELWTSTEALPLVTMTRLPLLSGPHRFVAGISVFLERMDPKDLDPVGLAGDDMRHMRVFLRDVSTLAPPAPCVVSRSAAATYTIKFLFEHEQLPAPEPVRMHVLVVQQDDRFYSFRMYDAPNQPVDIAHFSETIRVL